MKLNKKLAILGVGLSASTGSLAQTFYQCLPCPSGTYSSNSKCIECARDYYCSNGTQRACPSGTYAPPGATSCCAGGQYAGNSSCFSLADLRLSHFTQIASGGAGSSSCPTGTLQPGWYLVRLRGGKGGKCGSFYGCEGGNGGTLQYAFYIPATASYQLCAGGDGSVGNNPWSSSGGGAGGSWLKLNFSNKDYYFVAGGGGGGDLQGGGGGGIGGGGGAGASSDNIGGNGGRSGPYAGGSGAKDAEYEWSGVNAKGGQGLNNGGNGWKTKYLRVGAAGGGGGGYSDHEDYGGSCAPITINIITGYMTTGTKRGNFGGIGNGAKYEGTGGQGGGTGKSSHSSNVPNIGACGSSCAILYKLNM